MILKPKVTQIQKDKFLDSFQAIVERAPESVQKLFESITWNDSIDEPIIMPNGFVNKLTGKLADDYTILFNKLLGRTL